MNSFIENIDKSYGVTLTSKQRAVVEHTTGPALVLSCAGSGKTTVNIIKCANLILEHGVKPSNILSMTFSKPAALEMQSRFASMFGNIIKESVKFVTIHSLAYKIVNEFSIKNRIKLTVIEGENSPIKKAALIKQLNMKYNKERINDDKLDELTGGIGYCKNMLLSFEEIQEYDKSTPNFTAIYIDYERYKRQNNLVDFDDMLTLCNDILKKDKSVLERLRRQFHYIIVDESQDTSKVQYEIIEKLAYPKNNLTLIGDDDQAIYGFRGAYPDYLLNFPKKYAEAKIFYMDENFRSTKSIVSHASKLIDNNTKRFKKDISTNNKEGASVEIIELKDEEQQISFVIQQIVKTERKNEYAVLYRNNLSSVPIVDALDRKGELFYLRDYDGTFFNHWVSQDIAAFLMLAMNHKNIDAYERIYYKTGHYVSKAAIEYVENNLKDNSVFVCLKDFYCNENRMKSQVDLLINEFSNLNRLKPEIAIANIEHSLNYGNYLESNADKLGYSIDNLNNILNTLKMLARNEDTIEGFLNRLNSLQSKMEKGKFNKGKDAVVLSTIHSAKGLEFKNVCIIDLIDDLFPSKPIIRQFNEGKIDDMEEERRIYYVGITRAKEKLTLLGVRKKNSRNVNYSRFLSESISIIKPSDKARDKQNEVKNTGLRDFKDITYANRQHIKKKRESTIGIAAGTRIYHRKFEEGTIVEINDAGIAIVNFDDSQYGTKKIAIDMCMNSGIITPL